MKTSLFALAVLLPALVQAGDRAHRPYALTNGRSVKAASAPASAPQTGAAVTRAAGQSGSSVPSTSAMGGSQAAIGRRASGGQPQGHRSFWSGKRKADGGGTPTEEAPPNFSKPGALIRTEGQQPKYAEASPTRTHTVEGGSFIAIDARKAQDVGRTPGLTVGPKDTPPSANTGSAAGGNSITPNSGFDPAF